MGQLDNKNSLKTLPLFFSPFHKLACMSRPFLLYYSAMGHRTCRNPLWIEKGVLEVPGDGSFVKTTQHKQHTF